MRRLDLVTLLGGAALGLPCAAMAQQPTGMRRVGVLIQYAPTDPEGRREFEALASILATLGWVRGRNLQLEVRFAGGKVAQSRAYAKELVELAPDVITAFPSSMAAAVLRETKVIPVVFAGTTDPVGLGFVRSLAHPAGNATGFGQLQQTFGGKWLQTLKEIAPSVTRVLAIVSPDPGSGARRTLPSLQASAQSLGMRLVARFPQSETELLDAIRNFAREPGGGLVQPPNAVVGPFLNDEITTANHLRLPAIYGSLSGAVMQAGGLAFYGSDVIEQMPQVASYVDRILRGAKPGDLPVQNPIKFHLAINLKTAKALGLTVPQSLLLQADEVIR